MKITFFDLCNFKVDQGFKLLYRASQDGFRARDFHDKCDNHPNTITIIQTTNDYIFGGYAQVCWSGKALSQYVPDSNAFLFSLVNKENISISFEIHEFNNAIVSGITYGPTFGEGHDIYICNNSNVLSESYSKLSSYVKSGFNKFNKKNKLSITLDECKKFLVKEIEVFQLF